MSQLFVREAKTTKGIKLTEKEAELLNATGKKLVAEPRWEGDREGDPRSIWCERDGATWTIRSGNVIGAIGLGERTLIVTPKVSMATVIFLGQKSGVFPRADDSKALLAEADNFSDLVASWLVASVNHLLKSGLHHAYEAEEQDVDTVLGAMLPLPTALNFYSGRLQFRCEPDEFTIDNPPNRIIVEALHRVVCMAGVKPFLRREARGLISLFPGVGPMRHSDLMHIIDRLQQRYAAPLSIAKDVIRGTGRNLSHGSRATVTFLLPTPSLIEDGLREGLREVLPEELAPWKRRESLGGISIDPDLRFGKPMLALGDVKYKLYGENWRREDVFQLTTYVAGFKLKKGLLIGFTLSGRPISDLFVGRHVLRTVLWDATEGVNPENELRRVAVEIRRFTKGNSWASSDTPVHQVTS